MRNTPETWRLRSGLKSLYLTEAPMHKPAFAVHFKPTFENRTCHHGYHECEKCKSASGMSDDRFTSFMNGYKRGHSNDNYFKRFNETAASERCDISGVRRMRSGAIVEVVVSREHFFKWAEECESYPIRKADIGDVVFEKCFGDKNIITRMIKHDNVHDIWVTNDMGRSRKLTLNQFNANYMVRKEDCDSYRDDGKWQKKKQKISEILDPF